jgi:pimeloyl-ACP methyl ester carboxylesterase
MEQEICFINKSGRKLFGIAHLPEGNSRFDKRIGINLLNPGIKYRVAPHRLSVKLARELCNKGYFVFRFDPEGIGDSEGELPENIPVADVWGQIQRGLFVNDSIEANTYFLEKFNLDKLLMVGSCGGAITALSTAAQDPRVDGLCLIDIPVFQWDSKKTTADTIVGGQQTDNLFNDYVRMIFKPQYWFKVITLDVDFRTFAKVVNVKLKEILLPTRNNKYDAEIEELCREKKLNIEFFQGLGKVISRNLPMMFITAGNDPGRETFENYFQNGYLLNLNKKCQHKIDMYLIENANHSYSLTESQDELFDRIFTWLSCQHSIEEC